jgi:type I restriction enzyme S subunit
MSFPRYPSYKPSGVEWLGEVPEHWDVLPCRGIVDERNEKNEGAACQDYLSLMANVGIIPYEEKGDIGNKKPEDLGKCKLVRKGDFVINSMNYGIGSYGVSGYDGVCSPVYIVLFPNEEKVRPRFAFRIFEDKTFQSHAQSFGNGILAHRCAIGWDILKGIGVPVPSSHEQERILQFLDRETAKIDALIAEQQRLIELLQEKRQAVISHAVTKGLNPDAPMKDSGVEWLGEVPAHWEVCRVKAVSAFTTSGPRGWSERVGDIGALFVQSGDLTDVMGVAFERCKRVLVGDDAETARTKLRDGDVVVCITGAKTGNVAVCERVPEASYVNQHLCLIRPGERVHPRFLAMILKSGYGQTYFSLAQYGLKQGLSLEDVREAPVILPPREEQSEIIELMTDWASRCSLLLSELERTISLLQERRSALISAAVTGQIDVRGLVPEAEAA